MVHKDNARVGVCEARRRVTDVCRLLRMGEVAVAIVHVSGVKACEVCDGLDFYIFETSH